MYQIKDEKGYVYNTVTNPAAVFDKMTGTLYKIGEREAMMDYFTDTYKKMRAYNLPDTSMAEDVTFMDLPKDQTEIDKVFQITGYIKNLYETRGVLLH